MSAVAQHPRCYGLMAEFGSSHEIVDAVRAARGVGYQQIEAYTPFPVDGLSEALGLRKSPVPLLTLIGGLLGAAGGWFLQWYSAVIDYPINAGGRPLYSWPAFVPSTIELVERLAPVPPIVRTSPPARARPWCPPNPPSRNVARLPR